MSSMVEDRRMSSGILTNSHADSHVDSHVDSHGDSHADAYIKKRGRRPNPVKSDPRIAIRQALWTGARRFEIPYENLRDDKWATEMPEGSGKENGMAVAMFIDKNTLDMLNAVRDDFVVKNQGEIPRVAQKAKLWMIPAIGAIALCDDYLRCREESLLFRVMQNWCKNYITVGINEPGGEMIPKVHGGRGKKGRRGKMVKHRQPV